ncbi:MAG: glycosyltransferase family 9 protein [Chthoniobacterales bacterium]|nr:glycosyltransferase family 9 protein [Chthoniobacterales bacterium]
MNTPFHRALVIRGGALGDFLLTLPVLASLREAAPDARLEILAYPGLASVAKSAGFVDAVRPIEYGPLAGFFTHGAILDPALRDYFASFDLVLSYLYDPDDIFAGNLHASGVRRLIRGPHRIAEGAHAIDQLAAPLADLGIPMAGRAVRLGFDPAPTEPPTMAIHPGSGSSAKNWAPSKWADLAHSLLAEFPAPVRLAVIGGEADTAALEPLRPLAETGRVVFWENLPLPDLAGRLSGCRVYLGHDTGISHLAAAAGTPSLLLFGPTDPSVWAPPHEHVRYLRAPGGDLDGVSTGTVLSAVGRIGAMPRLASGGIGMNHPA